MAIVITKQPTNVLGVEVGDTITFSVEATGVATYQWQYKSLEGQYWSSLPWTGNTTATVTGTANANNILFLYRCKLTDDAGNVVYTNEVRVNVEEEIALEIIKQPQNVTALVGSNAVFTVEAAGTVLTYQWQYRNPAVTTEWAYSSAADAQTATLTIAAETHRNGYQYRCVVRDANSNQLISAVVTLTVATSGLVDYDTITGIANAIRAKLESTSQMSPEQMEGLIESIKKGYGVAGAVTPTADTATLNIGTTLPSADNFILVVTDESKISGGSKNIVMAYCDGTWLCNRSWYYDGFGYDIASNATFDQSAGTITAGTYTSQGTITRNIEFKANWNYLWAYASF